MMIYQIPTPTPLPTVSPDAFPGIDPNLGIEVNTVVQTWAYSAINVWRKGSEYGLTDAVQIMILVLLIIGGIVMVVRAVDGFND